MSSPIALTVDVEDWFDGLGLAPSAPAVEAPVDRILSLLAAHDRRATFFVLGDLARRHPGLVRRIADAGHEVGCHGADHTHLSRLDPDRLAAGLRDTRPLLEDLGGAPVTGFRAPFFSVGPSTAWALDVIAAAGFRYDASVYPGPNDRYGWPGAPDKPVRHAPSGLVIVPVPMLHPRLPVGYSGGAYLRMLPWRAVRRAGLLGDARVTDAAVERLPASHPVLDQGYRADRDALVARLSGIHGLTLAGRHGAWVVDSVADAMTSGIEAALRE